MSTRLLGANAFGGVFIGNLVTRVSDVVASAVTCFPEWKQSRRLSVMNTEAAADEISRKLLLSDVSESFHFLIWMKTFTF